MASGLPMPGNFGDAFMQGAAGSQAMFDSVLKNRLNPYQIDLLKAQTLEAQGKGAKATMLSKILQHAMQQAGYGDASEPSMTGQAPAGTFPASGAIGTTGAPVQPPENAPEQPSSGMSANEINGGPGSSVNPNQPSSQPQRMGNPSFLNNVVAGELGVKPQEFNVGGRVGSIDPLTGQPSYTQIGPDEQQKSNIAIREAEEKEFGTQNAKIAHDYDQSAIGAAKTLQTLDQMGEVLKSPVWAGMRQAVNMPIPLIGKAELFYYSKNGTPEQQQMARSLPTLTGQLIADSSKQFSGQFRKGEQSLLTGMKINDEDTVNGALGKYNQLVKFNTFLAERSKIAAKLIRQHVDPTDAQEAADRQLKGDLFRKMLQPNKKASAAQNESQGAYGVPGAEVVDEVGTAYDTRNNQYPGSQQQEQQPQQPAQKQTQPLKITKDHITEENILETMKAMKLSREEVMKRLKAKGLI